MQPLYDQLALHGHIVAVDRRAVGRANAGRVGGVLVQHGQTVQRADGLAPGQRVVRGFGPRQRLLRQESYNGVDGRVHPLDLGDVGLRQFDTGKIPATDAGGQFGCIEKAEISRHHQVRPRRESHL